MLIVFIVQSNLAGYGILRVSTVPIDPLLPAVLQRLQDRDAFIDAYTKDGEYNAVSSSKEIAEDRRRYFKIFLNSLPNRNLQSRYGSIESLTGQGIAPLIKARKDFLDAAYTQPVNSSPWEELLKLCFDCGVSSGKSSLAPVMFSDTTSISGDDTIIENKFRDAAAYYQDGALGELNYIRASRAATFNIGREIADKIRQVNQRVISIVESRTGERIPFVNVDYRIVARSVDDLIAGNIELITAEIHPDLVDFINDGSIFEQNGTLALGCVDKLADEAMAAVCKGKTIDQILCPQKWELNKLYRTEITTIAQALARLQGALPRCIDDGVESTNSSFNYPPILDKNSKSVPAAPIVDLLNDRRNVMSILKEATSGVAGVNTPDYLVMQRKDLPFSLQKLNNLPPEKPKISYDFIDFWKRTLVKQGLKEQLFYVVKPVDHSIKRARPVTFYDSSGFQTLLDYLSKYQTVLIEAVNISEWSRDFFTAGSVSEVKTLTINGDST